MSDQDTDSGFFVCLNSYPACRQRSACIQQALKPLVSLVGHGCTPTFVVPLGVSMETKKCKKCGQTKPVTEFHKAGFQNGVQQYRTKCAACSIKPRTAERWTLREQGLKKCCRCGQVKPLAEFYPDDRKLDGRKPDCKACFGESVKEYRSTPHGHAIIEASAKRHRTTAKWRETHRLYIRRTRSEKRYEQQERARKYVWDKVRRNGFPRPTEHACADCGKPATQYHHESYEREHWLDVTPLCNDCHKRRHCNA